MRDNKLKISVCIATYNHENYISACLASVVSQKVDAELEVLVGDDCSSDATRKIIAEYADKYPLLVTPVFHKENIGGSKNYQAIIAKASGDFITHLDGDDFWMPEKLAKQLEFMCQHTECIAVYTNATIFNNKNIPIGIFNNPQPNIFDVNYLLEKGNFLNHSSILYKAQFKNEILKFNSDFIDYRIHLYLAKHGMLGYLNEACVVYRYQSSTSSLDNMPTFINTLYWESILGFKAENVKEESLKKCIRNYYAATCVNSIKQYNLDAVSDGFKRIQKYYGLKYTLKCVYLTIVKLFEVIAFFPLKKVLKVLNSQPIKTFHIR
jgi:glycosyltransferase involved in cell wall biosynthesis